MSKSHRHYEFGTFAERMEHACALFETDPPEIIYEDGEPTMTDPFMQWIKEHGVNMDWLFAGSPCSMLRQFAKQRAFDAKVLGINRQLDPEVQAGLLAFLRAVVIHGVPMEDAEPLFSEVMKEFQASQAKRLQHAD